ncbi:hypothetical protein [Pseudomonas abietaniphila]|nr:hypothetical protein [Pseudomonas abietaniphila]
MTITARPPAVSYHLLNGKDGIMKSIRLMLFSSFLMAACSSQLAISAALEDPVYHGRLKVYKGKDGSELTCTLAFENGSFNFKDIEGCENDKASHFILEEVPSAAFITFYDAPDCASHDNFIIKMKTVKHPTTTLKAVELTEAAKKLPNEVIAPGIIMISKENDQGDIKDKLSCVKIERSSGPGS